jgi:hypothetical protein
MVPDAPRAREQWGAARIEKETAAQVRRVRTREPAKKHRILDTCFVDEGDRVEVAWGEAPVIQRAS